MANIHAKPSRRMVKFRPSAGSQAKSSRNTCPLAISGYAVHANPCTASATAPASHASRLRALAGNSAAATLPANGSASTAMSSASLDINRELNDYDEDDENLRRSGDRHWSGRSRAGRAALRRGHEGRGDREGEVRR